MATDNKAVMIYLPKDLEEYITNFCAEYDITRKDKDGNLVPSIGTGVVTYLKRTILSQSPSNTPIKPIQPTNIGLNKQEVLDLIDQYFTSKLPVENSDRKTPNLEDTGISEQDTLYEIENSVQQALIGLDMPSREEFDRLKQQMTLLHKEVMR